MLCRDCLVGVYRALETKRVKILSFNQTWLADELRTLGHDVVTCGHTPDFQFRIPPRVTDIKEILAGLGAFSPDVLLYLDDSLPALIVSGLDTCDIPSVFYSVDTHHHKVVHSFVAPLFDHILVAQRDYLSCFLERGLSATWFPLWAPRFVKPSSEKRFAAAFVGTLDVNLNARRVAFFEALVKRIPIHVTQGRWWEVFPFADIVVNQSVQRDLNFRVFEAMMCGSVLLTERTSNGLLDLFRDGLHLVTYQPDDIEEVVEKVVLLHRSRQTMQEIAHAGREEILSRHTALHRAVALEQVLKTVRKNEHDPRRHYISMVNSALINSLNQRRSADPCLHAASAALLAAEEGLRAQVHPSETETTFLISACGIFDKMTDSQAGELLIQRFQESIPENPLLALARIHRLLERGDSAEAERIATSLSGRHPEQTYMLAQQVIPKIVGGELTLQIE